MNLMPTYDKIIVGSVKTITGKSKQMDLFRSPMKVWMVPYWEFLITDEKGKEYKSFTFHDKRWYEYYKAKIKKGNLLFIAYDENQTSEVKIFQHGGEWLKHMKATVEWCKKEISQLAERQKTIEQRLADYEKQV